MSEPHKVSKPRPYVFLVLENDPPCYVLDKVPPQTNYERVWNWYVDRHGQRDTRLVLYELRANGNGMDRVKEITGPFDLEKL